jgi:hypothetical protein
MKKRAPKTKQAPPDMDEAAQRLADLAVRYPFRWFTQSKCGRICGFGDDVMTALVSLGAPIVGRKSNPHLLHAWLQSNLDKIGKIRGDSV